MEEKSCNLIIVDEASLGGSFDFKYVLYMLQFAAVAAVICAFRNFMFALILSVTCGTWLYKATTKKWETS